MFNYDLAFDVVPGLAYVTGSPGGFGGERAVPARPGQRRRCPRWPSWTGSPGPWRWTRWATSWCPSTLGLFPIPADSVKLVRFDSVEVTLGTVLTDEADGEDFSVAYDGISSMDYDAQTDRYSVIEVNSGPTASTSYAWSVNSLGDRVDLVASVPGFAGGAQLVQSGLGTAFAGYQPEYSSLRISYSQCFGNGSADIFNVVPQQATAVFSGPGPMMTGPAFIDVEGGVPNGFASLWVARSSAWESIPLIDDIGGLYPVALQALFSRLRTPLLAHPAQQQRRRGSSLHPDTCDRRRLLVPVDHPGHLASGHLNVHSDDQPVAGQRLKRHNGARRPVLTSRASTGRSRLQSRPAGHL